MGLSDKCECCNTNSKKSINAKYCQNCSDHICSIIWQRVHRIDTRYKKVFQALHQNLLKLAEEDPFVPQTLKTTLKKEGRLE